MLVPVVLDFVDHTPDLLIFHAIEDPEAQMLQGMVKDPKAQMLQGMVKDREAQTRASLPLG